ncbi:ATPase [Sphingomonas koreensis]|jgi:two-component system phosphate regulon sensor histidine kinase PhoR|uniref:histidine kinase n=1 Tax=Sphingomonas koreensis TaxID=93064 RepID=A0A1L6JDX2_9SPHN|nr:ATP-binding protein [Sphingomonas koreensis]APR54114.1 ATPase [Sphingomonas koreensis]MDC7809096.1 ATP-binding protein [Sphingomonas koreensis]PJI90324.1 two-component system phosphate regulon sensor histidine kinase PhoR [Sphingomonas koreensis]RSU18750.1 ATPase [Sphingomonas koreensis]RSU25526.1 ATPase [Sphingomonas koreensis]
MFGLSRTRTAFVLLTVLVTAIAALLAAGIEAGGIALVGAIIAAMIAASPAEHAASGLLAPAPVADSIADAIEAIFEPVLLVAENRVIAANQAARTLLGAHILGEDVRVAIRHPAAAERLLNPEDASGAPIQLVGLGARDQHWEMRVRTLPGGHRIVHLGDRTGSHAADRIRVDFVANASHELRTPLASILGFIETLEDAADDPETRTRFLGVMGNEARRMQRLIDDLMSLSRIEAEKYRAPDDSVDLPLLIDEVQAELAALSPKRAGDIVVDADPVVPIRGDRVQLSQLLHNIVGNAMKYGRAGTPVSVSLRAAGESMVRLSVTDESEGIAPEHLPRLTERFYRVDSSRSRAAGGTGLGLAIVKHIVERHRGRLDIASTVGTGTSVTILLPTAPHPGSLSS